MYDNTVVQNLNKEEALKFLIDCNYTNNATKGHVLFGNGNFKNPNYNAKGTMGVNTFAQTLNKMVCIYLDDGSSAEDLLIQYYTTAPNVKVFTELEDFASAYVAQASKDNPMYQMHHMTNLITATSEVLLNRFIRQVMQNYNNGVFNTITLIYDTQGAPIEQIVKRWQEITKTFTENILAQARMMFFKLIQKAEYISGANDQLIVLNEFASIQYNVETCDEDFSDIDYAVLTIKGEKNTCRSEADLLQQLYRNSHLIGA